MNNRADIYRQIATLFAQLADLEASPVITSPAPVLFEPRTQACLAHTMANGVVTGITSSLYRIPSTKYKCTLVDMLTSEQSGGNPNLLVKAPTGTDVRMGTGFDLRHPSHYDAILPPGNPDNKFFMPNKFSPPDLGPLAFFIIEDGLIASDIVGGWGLPYGQHIGGVIEFQAR